MDYYFPYLVMEGNTPLAGFVMELDAARWASEVNLRDDVSYTVRTEG